MSYEYPPPPPPAVADMSHPQMAFIPAYTVPSQDRLSLSMRHSSVPSSSTTSPHAGLVKFNGPPPLRPLASGVVTGEKRKNKLGYPRVSMACGYCRRRKIRCIPIRDGATCQSCERMGKCCTFLTVEQQQNQTKAQQQQQQQQQQKKSDSISLSSSENASEKSSPSVDGGKLPETKDMATNMPSIQVPSSNPSLVHSYDLPNTNMSNWMAPDHSPNSGTRPRDVSGSWRPYLHESPITPPFPPYPGHSLPGPAWTPASTEHSAREEVSWQPYQPATPPMSYGGDIPSDQQYPTPSQGYDVKPIQSDIYLPPIACTVPSMEMATKGGDNTLETMVTSPTSSISPSTYGSWSHQPRQSPQTQQASFEYSKSIGEGYDAWTYACGQSVHHLQQGEQGTTGTENTLAPVRPYYEQR